MTLGVIPTITPFFLPTRLADFMNKYPLVDVKVIEESSSVLLDWLRDGKVDLAIMPLPVRANWALTTELAREKLFAAVCADHAASADKEVTLRQLLGTPFLFLKDGHCFREDVLAQFRSARIKPRIAFESGCYLTILNMVKAGVGLSVVPEMAVDPSSGCSFIPIVSDRPVRVIGLVQSRDRALTRAQRTFAAMLQTVDSGKSSEAIARPRRLSRSVARGGTRGHKAKE